MGSFAFFSRSDVHVVGASPRSCYLAQESGFLAEAKVKAFPKEVLWFVVSHGKRILVVEPHPSRKSSSAN